ncbi:MAG: hypothetical protein RLZZ187_1249 [Pseudomonadota bacterium]|jgi:hypothetical protein
MKLKNPWKPEDLKLKSPPELKIILQNAERLGDEHVCDMCRAELAARRPVRSLAAGPRATRSSETNQQAKKAAELLFQLHTKLTQTLDLTVQTAERLSGDYRGFRAHRQPTSAGRVKTGGAQVGGKVAFLRYLSYRLKGEICNFSVLRLSASPDEPLRYQVLGPSRLLDRSIPITELRSFVSAAGKHELLPGGEEYTDFDEAAARYAWMLEQIAPRLN